MFVLSVKAEKKRLLIGLAAALLASTLLAVAFSLQGGGVPDIPGETNDQRVVFLQQYGWEVEEEPIDVQEVILPEEFNDVYTNYNAVQKTQNMDLEPFAGKTCKQWVYHVTNYPGEENVRATLLVYEGNIIGGDLSSAALDGFLCNFYGDLESGMLSSRAGGAESTGAAESGAPQSAAPSGEQASAPADSSGGEAGSTLPDESAAAEAASAAPTDADAIPEDAWPTD